MDAAARNPVDSAWMQELQKRFRFPAGNRAAGNSGRCIERASGSGRQVTLTAKLADLVYI